MIELCYNNFRHIKYISLIKMIENYFSEGLANKGVMFLAVFLGVSLLVVLAIMLDLWDGVHTARVVKDSVHSHKLRITIAKMCEYWRFIVIGFLIDCIGLVFSFYVVPFMVVLFGLGLILTEVKSMFEHARRRKSHTGDLPDLVREIVKAANERDARIILDKIAGTKDESK